MDPTYATTAWSWLADLREVVPLAKRGRMRWVPHRMALSWQSEQLDHPARSVEDLSQITCPVILFKGTVTAGWLKRVVDVLGERLPRASVVALEGDHACHIPAAVDRIRSE